MAPTCEIRFESSPMKAGQWLRGTVQLNLTKEQHVCRIYICFQGVAKCIVSENKIGAITTYTRTQKYLNEQRIYFVGDGGQSNFRLLPGRYNYTFQCLLPPNMPASLEENFGHIRYTATVVLDYPSKPKWPGSKKPYQEFEMPFTVIQGINSNDNIQLKEPVIVRETLSFYSPFMCLTKSLRIVARTPIGGYTPGQIINVEINIENGNFQPISEFSIKLIKQITYHWNCTEQMEETVTVVKRKIKLGNGIARKKSIHANMKVPSSILPSDSTSDIIKFGYFIRIIGYVGLFHKHPKLHLPITIFPAAIHNI